MNEITLEDLTNKGLLEHIGYWIQYAQYQSPPFTDAAYSNVWEAYMVLVERMKKDE
ncbi:unnamed protein product [marine sediment metagenome]|uniref:Uncharacterized protein n=1 Tax=marine sediment metagenome TaxID=412755 RepID=X0W061_9ZZZZ